MKTKELNRYLINKLSRAEYTIKNREAEVDELTEKLAGFDQLLEVNQKVLMWALEKLATYDEESKSKQIKISMTEVYDICKKYQADTKKVDDCLLMTFKER